MNYKVKVNNEAESKEVQELFFELGYVVVNNIDCEKGYVVASKNAESPINFDYWQDVKNIVTIQQLRDLVVLKRNDVGDATHINFRTNTPFLVQGSKEYFYLNNKWILSDFISDLKPIEEKSMKEFLVNHNNKWTLQLLDSDTQENNYRVAVPEGMNIYWEEGGEYWFSTKVMGYRDAKMVWQRSEIESLNDQYAEIEKVRQETVKAAIDGVEAFNAIANDINVQYRFAGGEWKDYTQDLNHESRKLKAVHFLCDHCEFRYKPKAIVVNGVEYEDEQKAVKVVQDYFK